MGKDSKIEWTHHTFNPWIGCTKVSPACDHCYAEAWDKRFGGEHWGPKAPRRLTSEQNWNQPLKWNREAEKAGERHRVFCASLADVFDNQAPEGARGRLWELIKQAPWLDWLLLTKRPQNIAKMLPDDWRSGYPNVWLGTTVENQAEADRRIEPLLQVSAVVHFLSCEPLLGRIDLWKALYVGPEGGIDYAYSKRQMLHWVICGGESGPDARPMHPDWARSLRDQCARAGVPFHFKQWGEWAPKINGHAATAGTEWGALAVNGALRQYTTTWNGRQGDESDNEYSMIRVGKKATGRLLDGREWNELPTTQYLQEGVLS
jgi:protein gp37